jgi:hypothetical protein
MWGGLNQPDDIAGCDKSIGPFSMEIKQEPGSVERGFESRFPEVQPRVAAGCAGLRSFGKPGDHGRRKADFDVGRGKTANNDYKRRMRVLWSIRRLS